MIKSLSHIYNRNLKLGRASHSLAKAVVLTVSVITGLVLPCEGRGETVSQKQAKAIAGKFFNAAHGQVMAEPKLVYNGRRLTTGSYFAPFYVYNLSVGGYVIISAENKTFPILAYSLKDSFDPNAISANRKQLLKLYARHIENIRYDSSVPYEAIEAWSDIPGYINGVLNAKYVATDPTITLEESLDDLYRVSNYRDAYLSTSEFYSSSQWQDLVDDALRTSSQLPIGIITEDDILPMVVYGQKGDMYRLLIDDRDGSLWRLLPSEILSKGWVAAFKDKSVDAEAVEPQEEPFSFYESFMAENRAAEKARLAAIENISVITEPQVTWHGGGHFTVALPEEVTAMRVFNLAGALVQRNTFRDTNVAVVDLTQNPTGFYFAVFFGASGKPYSVKVFR